MAITRRSLTRTALLAALSAPLLSSCASGSGSPGSGEVPLRFSWWGNDSRAEVTRKAIDLFTGANAGITVTPETSAFDSYHERLSVQMAAREAPDVMQLQEEYMATFSSKGALLDLAGVAITDLDPTTTANGKAEGTQIGVPTGLSSLAIIANPKLFEDAGAAVPDDTTWTWDDFAAVARTISSELGGKVRGTKSPGWDISEAAVWTSQRGHQLFSADGQLTATREDLAALFALALQLMDDGAAPPAGETVEQLSLSPEQSGVATGRYAMQLDAVSNFAAVQKAAEGELKLLRLPSISGKAGDAHMMFVASQYWSGSATSRHTDQAVALIDFLANSVEAGKILRLSRGIPANAKIRAAVAPDLDETDRVTLDFIDQISAEVVPAPPRPAGSATFSKDLQRFTTEVLFKRQTPEQAAEGLAKETEANLAQAQ